MRHHMTRVIPWLVTIVIFVVIFQRVPLGEVMAALQQVHLSTYFALMVPYSLAYCCLDAFVLSRVLTWFHTRVPYRRVLPVRAAAYILALLNPGLGHGAVAFALHRREGMPFLEIAGSLLFLTVLEFCQLAMYAAVGIFGMHPRLALAFVPIYAVLGAGVGIGLFCIRKGIDPFAYALTRVRRWLPGTRPANAESHQRHLGLFHTFRRAQGKHYVLTLLYKAPNFFLAVLVHYFALQLFDVSVPLLRLLGFLPIVFLVASLPVTVAHLGTSQAAWLYFFSSYGAASQLLAYSLVAHFTFMALNGLIGVCFLRSALQGRGD